MSIFKQKNYIPQTTVNNEIDDNVLESVRLYALSSLSPQRYEHSMRVAKTAKDLCLHFGEDEKVGFLAGLGHDICKEMDRTLLEEIAIEEGGWLSETEVKKPSLLHGRVGARVLQKRFNIENKDVLEAVAFHTFGKNGMGNIAKIVCIADKIEPGRAYMTSSKMKNLLKLDLDKLLETVLKEIISVRRKKKDEVFPEALWIFEKDL